MPDVEAALEEVRYAFDVLKADGVTLLTNYEGIYLGDKTFDPLFRPTKSDISTRIWSKLRGKIKIKDFTCRSRLSIYSNV